MKVCSSDWKRPTILQAQQSSLRQVCEVLNFFSKLNDKETDTKCH